MAKNLKRSRKNKMVAGVAAGLAEYFDIDPVIVRVALIISTLAWGIGIWVYIILWIVVPYEEFEWVRWKKYEGAGRTDDSTLDPDEEFASKYCETETKDFNMYDDITHEAHKERKSRHSILGLILVGIGAYFLLDRFFFFDFELILAFAFIAIGAFVLFKRPRFNN